MIDEKHRFDILKKALEGRVREITEYEVNIENFRRAILKIGTDKSMAKFRKQLEELLASNLMEQRKSRVIHDVIAEQLKEMGA